MHGMLVVSNQHVKHCWTRVPNICRRSTKLGNQISYCSYWYSLLLKPGVSLIGLFSSDTSIFMLPVLVRLRRSCWGLIKNFELDGGVLEATALPRKTWWSKECLWKVEIYKTIKYVNIEPLTTILMTDIFFIRKHFFKISKATELLEDLEEQFPHRGY